MKQFWNSFLQITVFITLNRSAGQTANKYQHVHGEMYITDIVHGLKFRISPGSFFQVSFSTK